MGILGVIICEKITYLQSAATLLTNNLQVTSNLDFQKNYYALLELKGLRICQLSTLEAGEISDNITVSIFDFFLEISRW